MYRPLKVAIKYTQHSEFDRTPIRFAELAPGVIAVAFKAGCFIAFYDACRWMPVDESADEIRTWKNGSGWLKTLLQDQQFGILLGEGKKRPIRSFRGMLKMAPDYLLPNPKKTRIEFFNKHELLQIPEAA